MLAEERLYQRVSCRLRSAAPSSRAVMPARGVWPSSINERRERQGRRAIKVPRHEEAPGRQGRKGALIQFAGAQISGECLGQATGRHLIGVGIRVNAARQSSPIGGQIGAHRQRRQLRRLPREFADRSCRAAAGRAATRRDSRRCRLRACRRRTCDSSLMPIHIRSSGEARIWRGSNPARLRASISAAI